MSPDAPHQPEVNDMKLLPVVRRIGHVPQKEAFIFEFDYWPKKITFRAVISPGDNSHREILSNALQGLKGANVPRGGIWPAFFMFREQIDVTDLQHTDEQIREKASKMIPRIKEIVSLVEPAILKYRDELSCVPSS
jgi:hypothetical protein